MPTKSPLADLSPEQRKIALQKARQSRESRGKARFARSKAIRYKCLDCCVGSSHEVSLCENTDCSLWEFRFGKNPTKEMAEEAKDVPVFGKDK